MNLDQRFFRLSDDQQQLLLAELRRIARRYMCSERVNHTLQATALVNEAYLNLAGKAIEIEDEHHFIAILARQMRRILVDHARQKMAVKRSKEPLCITLADVADPEPEHALDLIYLDQLLTDFAELDQRSCQAFELKLFSALTNSEIAELLGTSVATTERDLQAARAWFKSEMLPAAQ